MTTTNLKLSTNLIGVDGIFCTYWGLGKDIIDDWQINQDFNDGYIDYNSEYFWRHYNNSKFMDDWAKEVYEFMDNIIVDLFKHELGLDVTLEFCGRWSPREYNFNHDVVNFDISCEQGFSKLVDFCTNHPDFAKFLKDHYSSYDGFMSFTANNVDRLLEDIVAEDMTAYGAMISFILVNYAQEDFNYIEWDMHYGNYCDGLDELDSAIEDLKAGDSEEIEWGMNGVNSEMRDELIARYLCIDKKEVLELYNLDLETATNILQERYPNLSDELITNSVVKYWNEVDNKTADLFEVAANN